MDQPLTQHQLQALVDLRNTQAGFAALLGIHVETIVHGGATVRMDLGNPHFTNPSGTTVHGGVVFTLADIAAGCATWSSGYHCATAGADIHYLAPVLTAKQLIATASALQFGKRMYVFDVSVTDETNRLIAKGTYSYMTLKNKVLPD